MKEKTKNTKVIYKGRLLQLNLLKVKLPNNKYSNRETVIHPGAAAILPILPGNKIIFIKQYRKAVEKYLLEIPAGTLDKGESPLSCARRELIEETGYKARSVKKILDFFPTPGYSNERIYIFKATGLVKAEKNPEEDEFLETVILPINKVKQMIKQGTIKDGKTLLALSHFIK